MTQIVLDAAMQSKLLNFSQPLELCDETGKVLAFVTPANGSSATGFFEPPPLSEEEIARRLAEPDFSTAEVMEHLRKL